MSLTDTLTPAEKKTLQKLLKKRRKTLNKRRRFSEMQELGNILGKVDQEETIKPEDAEDLRTGAGVTADGHAVTKAPDPAGFSMLEATVSGTTRVFCPVIIRVEDNVEPDMLPKLLQTVSENLDRDNFQNDPDSCLNADISSSVITDPAKYPEPDFIIGFGLHEDEHDDVVGVKDVRNLKTQEALAAAVQESHTTADQLAYYEALLCDDDGTPIQLTAAEASTIHGMLMGHVGNMKTRGHLEDVQREIAILTKIGPDGKRLSPHLKKLSHDDKAVPPEIATSKR